MGGVLLPDSSVCVWGGGAVRESHGFDGNYRQCICKYLPQIKSKELWFHIECDGKVHKMSVELKSLTSWKVQCSFDAKFVDEQVKGRKYALVDFCNAKDGITRTQIIFSIAYGKAFSGP